MQEDQPNKLDDPSALSRKHYFINEEVEDKLRKYLWTSCTNVVLRDSIMEHANELIKQIIRKQNLHMIYPGHEESAFGDLVQTAWMQIEKTLYKFRAKPHCRKCYNPDRPADSALYIPLDYEYGIISYPELFGKEINPQRQGLFKILPGGICHICKSKLSDEPMVMPSQGLFGGSETIIYRGNSKVFNLWSQVARTVILAYVKKEGRDRKNAESYKGHLSNKVTMNEDKLTRFFNEMSELFKYNNDHIKCVQSLKELVRTDERPYDGMIGKLVKYSGLSRVQVANFIKVLRMRSHEFSDSPLSSELVKMNKSQSHNNNSPQPNNDES